MVELSVREESGIMTKVWNRRVVGFIVALSIFTYHSMMYDHLMPIFFEDKRSFDNNHAATLLSSIESSGGLGLSLRDVGMIMAVNGVITLFIQGVIFPIAVERVGVYKLFLFLPSYNLSCMQLSLCYSLSPNLWSFPPFMSASRSAISSPSHSTLYSSFSLKRLLHHLAHWARSTA